MDNNETSGEVFDLMEPPVFFEVRSLAEEANGAEDGAAD